MAAYLGEILPGYDPDDERPAIRLCPHALMDRVWEARQTGGVGSRIQCGVSLKCSHKRGNFAGWRLEIPPGLHYNIGQRNRWREKL